MRKLVITTASVMLGAALSLSSVVPAVYAQESSTASSASSVDCDAVMQALGQGKTMREELLYAAGSLIGWIKQGTS